MERKSQQEQSQPEVLNGEREPYTPPVIEQFPPLHDVVFGSNININIATLAG